MKTASSDMVIETTVKPISLAPRRREWRGTLLQMPHDVFDHYDSVIHDKAGGDGQRHEGQVVHTITEQVHHPERADE